MGARTRQRVPRRIEHFQGELTPLEQRVLLHADGRIGFAEIAWRLGISEQEVVAVALALSGVGAVVLTAVPPPLPKRPASGTRAKVIAPMSPAGLDAEERGERDEREEREEREERAAEQERAELTEIEVDLDLSELERLMRAPARR